MYRKRPGTSGLNGALYETKLISLLLFRLQNDKAVEQFHLASNVDDVGEFDDIVLKVKYTDNEKPLLLFIQAKHKYSNNMLNVNDLIRRYETITKIKDKFETTNKDDVLFGGKYENTECNLVLYTNGIYRIDNHVPLLNNYSDNINNLLATGRKAGIQTYYTERDVESFDEKYLKEVLNVLVRRFFKYAKPKAKQSIMLDKYIQEYHVLLRKYVFNVSEIELVEGKLDMKWRYLTFREEFFDSEDRHLVLLKKLFYRHASSFVDRDKEEIEEMDPKLKLMSLKFQVPSTFGNIDLSIGGSMLKVEKRLKVLTNFIINLCETSSKYEGGNKIIVLDEYADTGYLRSNGGLGSAVGNLLVYDENTRLLKISDKYTAEERNAQTMYTILMDKIHDLHEYRFELTAPNVFPRLSFDYTDIMKEFFNKLIIYEKQSNVNEIEEILKCEINKYQQSNDKNDLKYLYYHNEVQKWWMSDEHRTPYLSKTNNIYKQALENIISEQQMKEIEKTFIIGNIKYFEYEFNENVTNLLKPLNDFATSIIVSDIITLTTVKVKQFMRNEGNEKHVLLNMECMLDLSEEDFSSLILEIKNTENILIITCNKIKSSRKVHQRLDKLAAASETKNKLIITVYEFIDTINEYFSTTNNIFMRDKQNLTDFTLESRKHLIKNSQINFQGQEISLDLLLNDVSVNFIKGDVLKKLIDKETITIGKKLTDYEYLKDLYIERRVTEAVIDKDDSKNIKESTTRLVKTFDDIEDNIVIITANAGMGKSTLLSHLSLKTKETDKSLWIIRINLLEHAVDFYKWQDIASSLNNILAMKFLCNVVIENVNLPYILEEIDNKMHLKQGAGDETINFTLNMFLESYNNNKIIFLFDGFDEICPHYNDVVLQFLNIVKNISYNNKIWITTRPYNDIINSLKALTEGKVFELEPLNREEQMTYLKIFWEGHPLLVKENNSQLTVNVDLDKQQAKTIKIDLSASESFNRILFEYLKTDFLRNDHDLIALLEPSEKNSEKTSVLEIPLYLNAIAEYVKYVNEKSENITININIYTLYEMFIEIKIKSMFKGMDIYKPNVMLKYYKERDHILDVHKTLATYYLFSDKNDGHLKELEEMHFIEKAQFDAAIDALKSGIKTDFVSHITKENIPVFIHRPFAEYFASSYICDCLKNSNFDLSLREKLYDIVKNNEVVNLKSWISSRRESDKELDDIITFENNEPSVVKEIET